MQGTKQTYRVGGIFLRCKISRIALIRYSQENKFHEFSKIAHMFYHFSEIKFHKITQNSKFHEIKSPQNIHLHSIPLTVTLDVKDTIGWVTTCTLYASTYISAFVFKLYT